MRDGEIVTACQAACPTQAIVFGNIHDRASQVARLKDSPLNYSLLAELNTLPRTTYLARIRNPHPDLAGPATTDTPPIEPTELDRYRKGPTVSDSGGNPADVAADSEVGRSTHTGTRSHLRLGHRPD